MMGATDVTVVVTLAPAVLTTGATAPIAGTVVPTTVIVEPSKEPPVARGEVTAETVDPSTEESAPVAPDTAPVTPDTAPVTPDTAPVTPDTAPPPTLLTMLVSVAPVVLPEGLVPVKVDSAPASAVTTVGLTRSVGRCRKAILGDSSRTVLGKSVVSTACLTAGTELSIRTGGVGTTPG